MTDLKDILNDNLEVKKKFIIEKVQNFNQFEQVELFKIFRKENISYSENNNGIFINLNLVNNKIINKIEKFIKYCILKKEHLNKEKIKQENLKNLLTSKNKSKPQHNNNKIDKTHTYIFNNELDIDQNDMYYQESNFNLPKLNLKN